MTAQTRRRTGSAGARSTGASRSRRALSRVQRVLGPVRRAGERCCEPVMVHQLLIIVSALLVGLGLFMVLSASSVQQYVATGSSYTMFKKQLVFAAAGLAAAGFASRLSVRSWKRLALPALGLALVLQVLVIFTPLGIEVYGNRNWMAVGGQRIQPSEFGKVALVLIGAALLTRKRRVIGSAWQALVPYVPVTLVLVVLVQMGHDMGTASVMLAIVVGCLFAAGARMRLFVGIGLIGVAAVIAMIIQAPHRVERVRAWLGGTCTDPHVEGCYQKVHGQYALADGGWWGLGPGESREKWAWLPEAHNDFIFAIIGEELGLLGTLFVVLLFALLGFLCYRIIAQSEDQFVRIATAGIMVWLVGQALINIGSVIGMLPIVGVPLPLVSSGGTALVASLFAIGMLVSFTRTHPQVREAAPWFRRHHSQEDL